MANFSRPVGRARCGVRPSRSLLQSFSAGLLATVCVSPCLVQNASAQTRYLARPAPPESPRNQRSDRGAATELAPAPLGGSGASAALNNDVGRETGRVEALRPSLETPSSSELSGQLMPSVPSEGMIDSQREALFRELADEFNAFDR